jgi:D-beta-D-heptose 7-phosphate kinase/D-beta-D-heptose 1-phosphate adenosyltransferase
VLDRLGETIGWSEAVILSDYAKGVLTERICRSAIESAGGRPVVVDPKNLPWNHFRGATVIKPNRLETERFVGRPVNTDHAATQAALELAGALSTEHVLVTRGSDGMTLASRPRLGVPQPALHLASHPRQLVDVTGAGDVVAATLTTALAAGADIRDATWLANTAAGIKVGKFGAAAVTGRELIASLGGGPPDFAQKVLTAKAAAEQVASWRNEGKRVVFTNGCFDLLHLGHVTYLERSRRQGDALVVGINSDASVKRLKGPARPIQSEADRAQILASLASVDRVVVFDENTPYELIRTLHPDVLTKGADYGRKQNVVGWDLVENWGGRVALIDLVDGRSTTRLVNHAA